ncbi:MAG: HAMP domain-containing histidine kinase [Cyanobacteria bacterium]|nr:HAMP domain-containing histidine kinase [Cyanobacteriota bacterium]
MNERLAQGNTQLLSTGILLAEEVIRDDLDKLGIITSQFASFAIYEKYSHFLSTGDDAPLESVMQRFLKDRHLDVIMLVNDKGEPVASTIDSTLKVPHSFKKLIGTALKGKMTTGLDRFEMEGAHPKGMLTLIAAAPIFSEKKENQVIGVLLLSRNIQYDFKGHEFSEILPKLLVRIYLIEEQKLNPVFSSAFDKGCPHYINISGAKTTSQEKMLMQFSNSSKEKDSFSETFDTKTFNSRAQGLHNELGNLIGYLVVSTPQAELDELKYENNLYIAFYLLLGVIIISMIGVWFKKSYINPINELSNASMEVSAGNLMVRVKPINESNEMKVTLTNFNNMLEQLEEKEQLKKTFIATLTHDLRTPLIAQKRVIEYFSQEFAPPNFATFGTQEESKAQILIAGLNKSNDSLLNMVNQLLETYQYDDGKIQLQLEEFLLSDLITECLEELSPLVLEKRIMISNQVPQEAPWVFGDYSKLKRVITNLVGNALENIAPQNTITLSSHPLSTNPKGPFEIWVQDNGPGIEHDLLPHIFERYSSGQGRRQKLGSGLGLFICRMIIELHGGTIGVKVSNSEGTTFVIHLPNQFPPSPESMDSTKPDSFK